MKKSIPAARPVAGKDRPNVLPLEGEIDLHISPNVAASLNLMIEKKPRQLGAPAGENISLSLRLPWTPTIRAAPRPGG